MQRRLVASIGMEAYAALLTAVRHAQGLQTDEAKYLLNIPYPHPPLLRWILGLTRGMPLQDLFWRFVFASLCVQCVWLVWDMGSNLPRMQRMALSFAWLTCAAVMLQAGTIMMAPITALFGLVFLWMVLRPTRMQHHPAWIGFLWMANIFTAYQGMLWGPIVAMIFYRCLEGRSGAKKIINYQLSISHYFFFSPSHSSFSIPSPIPSHSQALRWRALSVRRHHFPKSLRNCFTHGLSVAAEFWLSPVLAA